LEYNWTFYAFQYWPSCNIVPRSVVALLGRRQCRSRSSPTAGRCRIKRNGKNTVRRSRPDAIGHRCIWFEPACSTVFGPEHVLIGRNWVAHLTKNVSLSIVDGCSRPARRQEPQGLPMGVSGHPFRQSQDQRRCRTRLAHVGREAGQRTEAQAISSARPWRQAHARSLRTREHGGGDGFEGGGGHCDAGSCPANKGARPLQLSRDARSECDRHGAQ
jgi:hypothetical protein